MTDKEVQKELEFVMRVGVKMIDFMLDNIIANFESHEVRSRVLFNLMSNFVANTMSDISTGDKLNQNITEIIEHLQEWMKDHGSGHMVGYDGKTEKITILNKQGLH